MPKPRLTKKVIRGLKVLSREGEAWLADVRNQGPENSNISRQEMSDAGTALDWIAAINAWKSGRPAGEGV